jgi:hypothetical protein
MPRPGWGAIVSGDAGDLADWSRLLKAPFDPWAEAHGGDTVLRSASLDELSSLAEARDRAAAIIGRLNGTFALCEETKETRPLRYAGIVEFTPDGRLNRTRFAEAEPAKPREKGAAEPQGKPAPSSSPRPSDVQQWAFQAESDELLDDALIHFGRIGAGGTAQAEATDWFDVYKALECLIRKFGPTDEAFVERNWAPAADVKLLKDTANWARHARRKNPRPPKAMGFEAARTLLGQLLRRALSA